MNENNKEVLNNQNIEQNKKNGSNTFNLIIGVATLLIALLGATFAYFSATARSQENDLSVKSAYVSISYDGGTEIKATNLIPATETVVMTKYKKEATTLQNDEEPLDQDDYTNDLARRCIDAKGREVCYVYQFTIESKGEEGGTTDIAGAIRINENEFDNLSYFVYKVDLEKDNEGKPIKDKYGHNLIAVNGFHPLENNFEQSENPEIYTDNIEYRDYTFAKFEKPYDAYDNGNYSSTVHPLACLFGYSDTYETDDADQLSRCSNISIENNEKNTYQVVIWLEETKDVQEEQGKSFKGTVLLEVPIGQNGGEYDDGKVTGKQ